MDFGTPVAAGTTTPNPLANLSGLINLQQQQQQLKLGAQQLQTGENTAQAAQQTMQERAGVTQMMKSGLDDQGNSIRDKDGEPDPAKILPALGRMAPLTGQQYAQSILQTHTAKVALQSASTALGSQQRQALAGPLQAIAIDPNNPELVKAASDNLAAWGEQHPEMAPVVQSAQQLMAHVTQATDPGQRAHLASSLSALFQPGQTVQTQPQNSSINNGQQTLVGTVAPPVAGGAFTPTSGVQQQLPPTTGMMGSDGTQGVIGAPQAHFEGLQGKDRAAALADIASTNPDSGDRQEAANALAGRPQGFVPQSLPAGQAQNIANNVDEMNRHFASLQDSASGMQLVSSLTGNIKALAHRAITGTDADKLAYANGLLAHLPGFTGQPSTDLKTATDLLDKNMAQLNLSTPASTDAQRSMVAVARPHSGMTADASDEASDQLVGQIKANMAMRNMLSPSKMMGDVPTYNAHLQQLEQVADPRIWQLEGKTPQEQKAFMDKLQPADKTALVQKANKLHQMGMLQ